MIDWKHCSMKNLSDAVPNLVFEEQINKLPTQRLLHKSIAETLRTLILQEKLPNGFALREEPLAERLGVSRGPIREAIRLLAQEGLVEVLPRRGGFVRWVSKEHLEELVLIREGIETAALLLAMTRNQEQLESALNDVNHQIREAIDLADAPGLLQAELLFHDEIYHHSNSDRVQAFWSQIRPQVLISLRNDRAFIKGHEVVYSSHVRLLEAIQTRDTATATAELRGHIHPVSRLGTP